MRLTGIKAHVGYSKYQGGYGGKIAVVGPFYASSAVLPGWAESSLGNRRHVDPNLRGPVVPGGRRGPVVTPGRPLSINADVALEALRSQAGAGVADSCKPTLEYQFSTALRLLQRLTHTGHFPAG